MSTFEERKNWPTIQLDRGAVLLGKMAGLIAIDEDGVPYMTEEGVKVWDEYFKRTVRATEGN